MSRVVFGSPEAAAILAADKLRIAKIRENIRYYEQKADYLDRRAREAYEEATGFEAAADAARSELDTLREELAAELEAQPDAEQ